MPEQQSFTPGPSEAENIRRAIRADRLELHTAMPGTVDGSTFDPSTASATIQPAIQRKYKDETEAENLPLLAKVPIAFQGGAGFSFTFPLDSGDTGVITLMERSISRWKRTARGQTTTPPTAMTHDLSDGVFSPGARPLSDPAPRINKDELRIGRDDGSAEVSVHRNGTIKVFSGDAIITVVDGTITIEADNIKLGSGATDPVALQSKVEARLTAIESAFNTFVLTEFPAHVHSGVTTGGGLSGVTDPGSPIPAGDPVGATKAKGE